MLVSRRVSLRLERSSLQPLNPTERSSGERSNRRSLPSKIRPGAWRPLIRCRVLGLLLQHPVRVGTPILSSGSRPPPYLRTQCRRLRSLQEQRPNRTRVISRTSLGLLTLHRTQQRRLPRSGPSPNPEILGNRSLQLHLARLFAPLRDLISQLQLVLLRPRLITNRLVPPILLLRPIRDRSLLAFSPSVRTPSVPIHSPRL
jgi:hypothetical protein